MSLTDSVKSWANQNRPRCATHAASCAVQMANKGFGEEVPFLAHVFDQGCSACQLHLHVRSNDVPMQLCIEWATVLAANAEISGLYCCPFDCAYFCTHHRSSTGFFWTALVARSSILRLHPYTPDILDLVFTSRDWISALKNLLSTGSI